LIQLTALIILGCVFLPPVRAVLFWVGAVAVAVLLGAVVYRLTVCPKYLDSTQRPLSPKSSPPVSIAPEADQALKLDALDWYRFEKLVEAVYKQNGYAVQRTGGANPDGGIDLVVSKDNINFGVQCKHWKSWKVGVKQIREFLGALVDRGLSNGIFITLQEYTSEAQEFASKHSIRLVDQSEFMQMLESIHWKWNPAVLAVMNDERKVCPKCESEMVLRTATKGRNVGQQFWGCSTYPRCKGIVAA
jgi:hypothetical protein